MTIPHGLRPGHSLCTRHYLALHSEREHRNVEQRVRGTMPAKIPQRFVVRRIRSDWALVGFSKVPSDDAEMLARNLRLKTTTSQEAIEQVFGYIPDQSSIEPIIGP